MTTELTIAQSRVFGMAAINYQRAHTALDNGDIPGFGAAFAEMRRFQEMQYTDECSPEHRKSMRVMVETLESIGSRNNVPFIEHGSQTVQPWTETKSPIDIAPDMLAALGRYAYFIPFCMIQSSLLSFDMKHGPAPAADRAYGFYWELSRAMEMETSLIALLDGAQVSESDPVFVAYEFLKGQINLMGGDVADKCAARGIRPQRMGLDDKPDANISRGTSTDCGTQRMGELIVAYAIGLSHIEGRRRRFDPYQEGASAVIDFAYEIAPHDRYIGGYKDILPDRNDINVDAGDLQLAPGSVAHALRLEILRRGDKKFKREVSDLIMSGRRQRVLDSGMDSEYRERLVRFGLMAAEYAGFLLLAGDLRWSIWPERIRIQMRGRRMAAENLLYEIMATMDADQTPDAEPMVVAVDYILRDIRRVENEAQKEQDKLTRRIRRQSRRRAA